MRRRRFLALAGAAGVAGCAVEPTPEPRPQPSSDDPLRPAYHYTALDAHLADPNGLVRFRDAYHLFHQSDGRWAHATSPDLVRWRRLPIALEHDGQGQALSGSAVVDDDRLVAIYTSTAAGEAQSRAVSTDGVTFVRDPDQPVIPNDGRRDFRDPKVFRHEPSGRWIMVVSAGQQVLLFGSADLRTWTELSSFGAGRGLQTAVWECPDLYALPGPGGDPRWVLSVSVGDSAATGGSLVQWFLGDFDGTTFVPADPADRVRIVDHGQDFYAAQTWSGLPDGRRVWLGWLGNWRYPYGLPTSPWKGAMSVPRELALVADGDDVALAQTPVAELAALRGAVVARDDFTVDGEVEAAALRSVDLELRWRPGAGTSGLRLLAGGDAYVEVGVDRPARTLYVDRTRAGSPPVTGRDGQLVGFAVRRSVPLDPVPEVVELRVLVDRTTVEVFGPAGRTLSVVAFPPASAAGIRLFAADGTAQTESLRAYPMDSIWAE